MNCRCAVIVTFIAVFALASASAQDNWNGGNGNWSTPGLWSLGTVPGPSDDVTIYSGGNDYVILDPGTASIDSLTLGGSVHNGKRSVLLDGGVAQNLTIAQSLAVDFTGQLNLTGGSTVTAGALLESGSVDVSSGSTLNISGNVLTSSILATGDTGGGHNTLNIGGTLAINGANSWLYLVGNGDIANVGTLVNNGTVLVAGGTTLNLTTQLNVTDVPPLVDYEILGNFNAGPNNAFATLASVEGSMIIGNGQTTNIAPLGGILTISGYFAIGNGTTVGVTGDVVNDNSMTTTFYVKGGDNSLNVSGMLTNNGQLYLYGNGDMANVGALTNNGDVIIGTSASQAVAYVGTLVNNKNVAIGPDSTLNLTMSTGGGLTNSGNFTIGKGAVVQLDTGFYQLANGTLGEAIGTNAFGALVADNGPVMLDGTLDIMLEPGFNPAIGASYKFFLFQPGELSGNFADIRNQYFNNKTEEWRVIYDNQDGFVELEAGAFVAPEPSSLLLLSSGLLGLAYGIRRRVK